MKSTYEVTPLAFSPAEVEAITGLSTGLQRDWRRRGILAKRPDTRHSGFQPLELARIVVLMAIRRLTDTNLETAADHADSVASSVLSFALMYPESRKFLGTMADKEEFEAEEKSRDTGEKGQKRFFDAHLNLSIDDDSYFSVFHGGKWDLVGEVQDIFDTGNEVDEGGIVINLYVLGRHLAERITHPLYAVKLAPPRRRG